MSATRPLTRTAAHLADDGDGRNSRRRLEHRPEEEGDAGGGEAVPRAVRRALAVLVVHGRRARRSVSNGAAQVPRAASSTLRMTAAGTHIAHVLRHARLVFCPLSAHCSEIPLKGRLINRCYYEHGEFGRNSAQARSIQATR
jgi:hypothetical protein